MAMGLRNVLRALGSSRDGRTLLTNAASLSLIQVLDYLVPLIMVPYLLRTIGVEKYGLLSFVGAFTTYFRVVIDYGFNLSATRQVAQCRDNHDMQCRLFWTVFSAKILLAVAGTVVFSALLLGVSVFRSDWQIYSWSFFAVVGGTIFPVWFFQGVERMKYVAGFGALSRIAALLLLFVVVRAPKDFMWVLYLQAAGAWVVAVGGLGVVLLRFRTYVVVPGLRGVLEELRQGFHVFVSQISVTLFTNTNTFFLGLLSTKEMVGVYAASEKIVKAVVCLGIPVGVAIYPRAGALFAESTQRALRFLRQVLLLGGAGFLVASISLLVSAPLIVRLVFGSDNGLAVLLVRSMSVLPLSVFIDNVYGTQIMLNRGMEKGFALSIVFGGVLSVVLLFTLVPRLGPLGAAISFVAAEIFCMAAFYWQVQRAGLDPLRRRLVATP